jgi:hypothetical protein
VSGSHHIRDAGALHLWAGEDARNASAIPGARKPREGIATGSASEQRCHE